MRVRSLGAAVVLAFTFATTDLSAQHPPAAAPAQAVAKEADTLSPHVKGSSEHPRKTAEKTAPPDAPAASRPSVTHDDVRRAMMRIIDEIQRPEPAPKPQRATGAPRPAATDRIRLQWRINVTWPTIDEPTDAARLRLSWR